MSSSTFVLKGHECGDVVDVQGTLTMGNRLMRRKDEELWEKED